MGLLGRLYRRTAATVEHQNRIQSLDPPNRMPYRRGSDFVKRSILLARG
jgi:hypothetical protein